MATEELRRIPIYRALHRPDLIAGCERELLLFTGLVVLALIVVAQSWLTSIVGGGLWFIVVFFLRKMAKADPHLSKIFARHIKYKSRYPACSTPFAVSATHKRGH